MSGVKSPKKVRKIVKFSKNQPSKGPSEGPSKGLVSWLNPDGAFGTRAGWQTAGCCKQGEGSCDTDCAFMWCASPAYGGRGATAVHFRPPDSP